MVTTEAINNALLMIGFNQTARVCWIAFDLIQVCSGKPSSASVASKCATYTHSFILMSVHGLEY